MARATRVIKLLTPEQVRYIRDNYKVTRKNLPTGRTQTNVMELATMFGVSQSTIQKIAHKKTYTGDNYGC